MKYLVQKYKLPDHWFPNDLKRQAKINEYLDWHHHNLRVGAAHTIFQKVTKKRKCTISFVNSPLFPQVLAPRMLGKEPNEERLKETMAILEKSQKLLENYFLKDTKFISSDEISIADLQAICEFTQFWVTGKDPCQERPRLAKWMEDCKKELEPHFDEAHKMIYLARDKGIFKGKL